MEVNSGEVSYDLMADKSIQENVCDVKAEGDENIYYHAAIQQLIISVMDWKLRILSQKSHHCVQCTECFQTCPGSLL